MGSEQKDDASETNGVMEDVGMLEETIADLKQIKTRSKTVFTKTRRHLLVSIQQEQITVENLDEECEGLWRNC